VTRRRREPDPVELLRFIAEHESLTITIDEFPELGEERIRAALLSLADAPPARPGSSSRPGAIRAIAAAPEPAPAAAPRRAVKAVTQARRVVLNTDGASRGNPGLAGAGWVISSPDGDVLSEGGAFLGRRTNNEAEYEAVIRGLEAAIGLGAEEVALRSDSELLIKQINGEYQVRNDRIATLHDRVRELMRRLKRVDARHVRREQNAGADAAANAAIDRAQPTA
jgi:ribonuclease HI